MGNKEGLFPVTALAVALMEAAPPGPESLIASSITNSVTTTLSTTTQTPPQWSTPDWQRAAGGKMAFDTASVRENTAADPCGGVSSYFPLGPGDVYIPVGGFFGATNLPLATYISFAYKITPNQEPFLFEQLPRWAARDRFDIQARARGNPSKDQMRLMMQALLAQRFRLAIHYETRQVPVFALVVDEPGNLGPLLQKHTDGAACPIMPMISSAGPLAAPQTFDSRFPLMCGGILGMASSEPGRKRAGARKVPMDLIASSLTGADSGLDRPILDRTGLTGRFDFAIEFWPQHSGAGFADGMQRSGSLGPTFAEALKDQLGLVLEAQTGPVEFVVVDYVERLAAN